MNNKLGLVILVFVIILSSYFVYNNNFLEEDKDEFRLDTILLKASIKKGGNFNGKIKISNLENYPLDINLKVIDLEGVAFLEKSSFNLVAGEIKEINVNFLNLDNLNEDIYFGGIEVYSKNNIKTIPIILEIESDTTLFDANLELFPSSSAYLGSKINSNIKIFDLAQIGTSTVDLTYFVKNFYGDTIILESETIVVDNQVSISKSFTIPKSIKLGDHLFGVIINYRDSVGTTSSFFTVSEKKLMKSSLEFDNILVFLIFALIIFILLIFIFYMAYTKDKYLHELRNLYRAELKKQDSYIKDKERLLSKKLKTKREREISKELFKKVRVNRRAVLAKIEKKRESELKKLRKEKKKKPVIKKQIEKWKSKGYDVSVLEKDTKIPNLNDIQNQIKIWKKKGYKTDVLEK